MESFRRWQLIRRASVLTLVAGLMALMPGCVTSGDDDISPEVQRELDRALANPRVVPPEGYTCGELRGAAYRSRQAAALLENASVPDPGDHARLKRRLSGALLRACATAPEYRRPAMKIGRALLRRHQPVAPRRRPT